MDMSDKQRRWWFANHPEYSRSRKGTGEQGKTGKKENSKEVDPKQVDEYVDNALKYVDGPVAEILKSTKRNFGTQAHQNERDQLGGNDGMAQRPQKPKKPQAIIRAPDPPNISDHARSVLDFLFPGMSKAYDRWRTGYYESYPWAPGPLYDALEDLIGMVAGALIGIQAALAKTANRAAKVALQKVRKELLDIWDWANFPRGKAIEDLLGRNLSRTFKGIDRFKDGVATSIKSMHLGKKTYQNPANILSRGRRYVDDIADFSEARMGKLKITAEQIKQRVLRLCVPPNATEAQKAALEILIEHGKRKGVKVEIIKLP